MSVTSFEFGKALYTVEELLCENGGIFPISRSSLYKLVREQKIPSIKLGKRVFVKGSYLDTFKTSN